MSKDPSIILLEWDENFHIVVDMVLYNMDFKMARYGQNIEQIRNIFKEIEEKKLTVDLAIVASFLGNTHEDGKKAAQKLRQISPQTKIIAYTHMVDEDWGDALAIKGTNEISQSLISAIEKFTGKAFKGSNVKEVEE